MSSFIVKIKSRKIAIEIIDDSSLLIDGKKINFDIAKISEGIDLLKIDNKIFEVSRFRENGHQFGLSVNGLQIETSGFTELEEKALEIIENSLSFKPKKKTVKAPMPGMILKLNRKEGDEIKKGDSVIILEAMKMENNITAPFSGTLKEIYVVEGSPIEKNEDLFFLE